MILLSVTLTLWFAGWIVLGRVRRCGCDELKPSVSGDLLSIIIPARNEEQNLPTLLRSLAAQPAHPREIIVVDDASTDRTAEVARLHGACVISSKPLPDGWRGKTWACHQGAQSATGKWLLFLDADTWFERDGLQRVLAEFLAAGGGVLSIAPHHAVRNFHEQFSAFFNLVMLAGTGAFTIIGDRFTPRGLLGQFLLIERTAYERVGGHEAVKGRILENFWLAEPLRAAGVSLKCRTGRGVFAFRMYPQGLRALVEGWTKGFASGAGQTPLPLLLLVVAWMTGLMFAPLGIVFAGAPQYWLAAYGLCAAQVAWLLRRVGTFHWLVALLYPVPLIFYFLVFARSLRRSRNKQAVSWKGRQIRAD
jgi:4,4'-diaponeurosporenoate glycosyltransferase